MKRKPTYLSNSALKTWESDRREYYLRYLTERVPKVQQTAPMAIGSAFDGMVKNAIEKMLGLDVKDYTRQVEGEIDSAVHCQAMKEGARVLDFYRQVGGINRLLVTGVPRMEFSVQCAVPGTESCIGGPVILLGKPDLYYRVGHRIVHDWKVNGYYSKASPQKGYVWDSKTRSHHKDIFPKKVGSLSLGRSDYFNPEWLDQLTGYGWCLGEPIGEEFVLQIHQITNAGGDAPGAALRLTEHRVLADPTHQLSLRDRLVGCWEAIHSGRVFTDMTLEQDLAEQEHCDRIAAGMQDSVFNLVCGR